jgi:hypothetical protein
VPDSRVAAGTENVEVDANVESCSGGENAAFIVERDDRESVMSCEGLDTPNLFNLRRFYESPVEGLVDGVERVAQESSERGYLMNREPGCKHRTGQWDARNVSIRDLRAKVYEAVSLKEVQKEELFHLLVKYEDAFTTKPGKCKNFSYKFDVNCPEPIVGHSRPIPFSARDAVRTQIEQMERDGILEISTSTHVNPLCVVLREGKALRICLDARRVNKFMSPDPAKVEPINELLQRFHGSRFISSIDLSSAFLQIELYLNHGNIPLSYLNLRGTSLLGLLTVFGIPYQPLLGRYNRLSDQKPGVLLCTTLMT